MLIDVLDVNPIRMEVGRTVIIMLRLVIKKDYYTRLNDHNSGLCFRKLKRTESVKKKEKRHTGIRKPKVSFV